MSQLKFRVLCICSIIALLAGVTQSYLEMRIKSPTEYVIILENVEMATPQELKADLFKEFQKYSPDWDSSRFLKTYSYIETVLKRFNDMSEYQRGVCHKVTPELILSVIVRESNGRNRLVSSAGALGLMQVMPLHLENLCSAGIINKPQREQLFISENNIKAGTYILMQYASRSRSLEQALSWYNAGPANASCGVGYARKVISLKKLFERASI